jgi:hypothetical protein
VELGVGGDSVAVLTFLKKLAGKTHQTDR